ncbi:MAG: tRNA (guanosine(46)-N7)-methyltransferase TrmB, partial [Simkania negevensis]|nr:tRNA (guanosine(46)-N7)-methyltransferase TrmB [Simkania negevensis]
MKTKELWLPIDWEKKVPTFQDQFFYLPSLLPAEEVAWPKWEEIPLFINDQPIAIEYCSGNGEWITEKAKEHAKINWVAVEKKFRRAKQIYAKKIREGIDNLVVVFGEALSFTKGYLVENTISQIYINFPDPWPKRRDAKHRLIQGSFIEEMQRILKQEKLLTIVSDHQNYMAQIKKDFNIIPSWMEQLG